MSEVTAPQCEVQRLDHLGIVAGVIKDLKLIEQLDEKLGTYEGEALSAGEAVAGMIINGLGFSNKPMTLTPMFFQNVPLTLLFRGGIKAEDFNRFKLGRVLDRCHSYGTELLFSQIALQVCRQENVDTRFNSLDSTSFSMSGEYLVRPDDETVTITLGHSKDHRPDLKQVMLEMMVSQDGGIPLLGKALNGNDSDNTVFKERTASLIESFKVSETPRYLVADSKLYAKNNASNLNELFFITRIPETIGETGQVIDQALAKPGHWQTLADGRRMQQFDVEHYGMKQRWYVLSSDTSIQRASKQVDKKTAKELATIERQLYHLQAKRFNTSAEAEAAAQTAAKTWKYHRLSGMEMVTHASYGSTKGRPKKNQEPIATHYQVIATPGQDVEGIAALKAKQAHYIVGTNTTAEQLDSQEVVDAYKNQSKVETGFRFLKDPLFFAAAFFIKTPSRIMALLMVMLLSLLVYGIAERRIRAKLAELAETLPNQIHQATATPTLRWLFQLLYGISYVVVSIDGKTHHVIDGLTPLRQKIVQLFGQSTMRIYQISYGG